MDLLGERISVVGCSGSGKSTLARALSERLDAPLAELDAIHWGPGWRARPDDETRRQIDRVTRGDRWVVDGNYDRCRDLVWPRATDVVWLDYSLPRCLSRSLRRTFWRCLSGAELWNGNRETFRTNFASRDSILLWVIHSHGRVRRTTAADLDRPEHARLRVHRLRRPRDAAALH
ncbi:topology modulation protein [Pseudobythopirellula maris]|uniref:Topology modulation protein n=1 Tax=Pseudobythopirellula maris TaxID=2527991 RepID=A0A5C5ZKQ5_9BACT|nr:adenylate kinase [Pseudobythopirellula maris]TWT87746.1 topology modulation protein [Pseudobythopirellula maris]